VVIAPDDGMWHQRQYHPRLRRRPYIGRAGRRRFLAEVRLRHRGDRHRAGRKHDQRECESF
jgi:hypothetical protein